MSSEAKKAIAKKEPPRVEIVGGAFAPTDMDSLWRMSEAYYASGLAPRQVDSPQKCFIIMAKAMEVGIGLMQSLESIAIINGKASIWGDAITALIHRSGQLVEWEETYTGDPRTDERTCTCRMVRRSPVEGGKGIEVTNSFSVADAKRAGLVSKGPWTNYPDRMLKMRARGFTARDLFSDVLGGLYIAEELQGSATLDTGHASDMPSVASALNDALPLAGTTSPQEPYEDTDDAIDAEFEEQPESDPCIPEQANDDLFIDEIAKIVETQKGKS